MDNQNNKKNDKRGRIQPFCSRFHQVNSPFQQAKCRTDFLKTGARESKEFLRSIFRKVKSCIIRTGGEQDGVDNGKKYEQSANTCCG